EAVERSRTKQRDSAAISAETTATAKGASREERDRLRREVDDARSRKSDTQNRYLSWALVRCDCVANKASAVNDDSSKSTGTDGRAISQPAERTRKSVTADCSSAAVTPLGRGLRAPIPGGFVSITVELSTVFR